VAAPDQWQSPLAAKRRGLVFCCVATKCWKLSGKTLKVQPMIATKALLKASWHASTGMLRTRNSHSLKEAAMPSTPLMVPIRSLGPSYRERITLPCSSTRAQSVLVLPLSAMSIFIFLSD
jgi:hypothetical protein